MPDLATHELDGCASKWHLGELVSSSSGSCHVADPKEAYSKVRERLLELEIEKEEQQK